MNPPPVSYDETLRTYQQESRELREAHKSTEARLNNLTELLHKFARQMEVNNQPPSNSNPLPSQPLPNPKGGINMEIGSPDKEEKFFIATVYGGNEENPEDLPEKYANPGPHFVTYKVGKIYVPDCLCDPGASEDVIVKVGRLSIPTDFHVIRTSRSNNESNPQVLLGRPFLMTAGFKVNFYDETFSLEVGNIIEIFQPTRPPISQEERAITPRLKRIKRTPPELEKATERKKIPRQ
ncbi:hypothetical protein PIB30_097199 [Stylosanthes scabra]|uniref:Uncharacterized protein n=1 Tax=Stylosanthes scabra TaxID=79078 RepID=A0ABU6WVU6_9FABA|nr:hypothetical protein [Stylosanthes scabra]